MNVSTSSATATASTSDVSSTQSKSKTSSTSKTTEKSFDEEMKTASEKEEVKEKDTSEIKNDKKTSEKDTNKEANKLSKDLQNPDDIVPDDIYKGGINFTDYKYHNEGQSILSQNIQNLLNTKDLMNTINSASTIDYDVINMSDSDANFFANLVQNTDMSMKSIASQISDAMVNNSENVQKNVQVSSVLMDKLSESMKTNQPFRIDFDKDVSVIIKVNKDGSLAANFIPGDKAVEQYLKNNISFLKQRFDDQNLPYSELSYSNSRQQQQERRKNNKENSNE
ncbi:unknown [Fusobacterium sp. CAG:439]|nr:unknown [Fusobacterium sp. CAG:439]